ncbi:unnamed protein product [Closterium sp. NIES-54]
MHSCLLVSEIPRSVPPLPPSPAPPCLPCVEERQRVAPHSSSFPWTTAPLQTLHMDVWGPARVSGQGCERYFLLVVDDYTRYTTVFPLRSKGQVVDVSIPWIRTVHLQLRERFSTDLPVLRLHSDRGGEFSSDLLSHFCRGEGILQSFTHPDSPQQNGIAEHRIGLVMEVARTSMIHTAAPHFLWPFAVRYAAHQLNLWPRVSLPETSPTLRWKGKVGDASVFRDVMFDELVPFYCLFPYHSAPLPPPPLFLAPGPPVVDPLPPQDSGAARGTASRGAEPGGAEPGGAETGGAEPEGTETGGVEPGGAEPKGVEPGGAKLEGVESGGVGLRVLLCLEVLLVLHQDYLRSSYVSGLFGAHTFGVELPELEVLEPLELEVLEFLLELVFTEVLWLLVMEVLVPGVQELPGLVVLGALELETIRSLELLELEALALEVLELEALAREALELELLELLTLEALCGHDRTSFPCFSRFLVSRLLLALLFLTISTA